MIKVDKVIKCDEFIKCDCCGREKKGSDWGDNCFHEAETVVMIRDGDIYPEGDYTKTVEVDLCPPCFKSKLIPFLSSIGCDVRTNFEKEEGL
jgi:hypothetical protein